MTEAKHSPLPFEKGFMTACSGDGEHQIKITFETLQEMQDAHTHLVGLASGTVGGVAQCSLIQHALIPDVWSGGWDYDLGAMPNGFHEVAFDGGIGVCDIKICQRIVSPGLIDGYRIPEKDRRYEYLLSDGRPACHWRPYAWRYLSPPPPPSGGKRDDYDEKAERWITNQMPNFVRDYIARKGSRSSAGTARDALQKIILASKKVSLTASERLDDIAYISWTALAALSTAPTREPPIVRKVLLATEAQHRDLAPGEPARFVHEGALRSCECKDCWNMTYPTAPTREDEAGKLRAAVIEECALVAEGFDAAVDSPRMKLFVEAGLVMAIYKRDGEIGAAIRALAHSSTER